MAYLIRGAVGGVALWLLWALGVVLVVLITAWWDMSRARRRLEQAQKEYYERMRSDA